jgi:hypothetical protein
MFSLLIYCDLKNRVYYDVLGCLARPGINYVADEMAGSGLEESDPPRTLGPRRIGAAPREQAWDSAESCVIRRGLLVERAVHSAGLDHGHYHDGHGKRHYVAIKGLQRLAFNAYRLSPIQFHSAFFSLNRP